MKARQWLAAARPGAFFGWWVVAGCFAMATACWGLAFYGNGLYLSHLVRDLGWPIAHVSPAFTVYFWLGAVFIITTGRWMDRMGPRRSASLGLLAMLLAVLAIARVQSLWQFYLALVVLAFGWASMSGAAINTTLARWFDERRGAALSVALTGASMGGILVVPLMAASIERFGFENGLSVLALALCALALLFIQFCFVRDPAELAQGPDGAVPLQSAKPSHVGGLASKSVSHPLPDTQIRHWPLSRLMRDRAFLSNVLPFSLGLLAQAGLLMHQITLFEEQYPRAVAAFAVVVTTASAMVGRLVVGYLSDRAPRRMIAAGNFAIQVVGILLFAFGQGLLALYVGCLFYGVAVGNMIAFPGLIVQREFPREQFAHVTRWVTAINQGTYALGPALLGLLREATGNYFACLMLCAGIGLVSSAMVWFARPPERLAQEPGGKS